MITFLLNDSFPVPAGTLASHTALTLTFAHKD